MPDRVLQDVVPPVGWTGEFADPELEAAYLSDAWPRLGRQTRVGLGLASVLYQGGILLDYLWLGTSPVAHLLAVLRLLVLGVCLGWVRVETRRAVGSPRLGWILVGTLLLVGTTELVELHSLLAAGKAALDSTGMPFVLWVIVMGYALAPSQRALACGSALAVSLGWLAYFTLRAGPGSPSTLLMALYLLLANGLGWVAMATWNRISRREFALRRELARAEEEERRASAAKSRFLAIMSHEILTPLNGVLGGAQLLQGTGLRPEQAAPLEILVRSGEQLERLLGDVLDLARIEAGRLEVHAEPFDPADLLQAVRSVVRLEAARKGLDLRLELPDQPPPLSGDALRLRQVLINLASNALKFTERGEVVLSLAIDPDPEVPGLHSCSFAVSDTGPGLDAAARSRLFEPFAQGPRASRIGRGGVGLGLVISRELVALMGGELRLDSEPGRGSRFWFVLRMAEAEAMPAAGAEPSPLVSRTVLVVDDDDANRAVAAGLLRILGHRPLEADSTKAALELLHCGRIDVVLTDVHLGDCDGRDLVRTLRALPDPRVAGIPVILSTADALEPARSTVVQGVLPKPIQRSRLARLLDSLPAPSGPAAPELVDASRVASLQMDLGAVSWARAVQACRESAMASLGSLREPGRVGPALHRLKGLAASYGLPALQARAAELEQEAPAPAAWIEGLVALARSSLAALEAHTAATRDPCLVPPPFAAHGPDR